MGANLGVVLALLFLTTGAATALVGSRRERDPPPRERLEECLQECRRERHGHEQQQCRRQCERSYEEEGGNSEQRDPKEELRECREQCRRQEKQQQRRECESRCEEEYKRREGVNPEEEEDEERERKRPYFLDKESFQHVRYSQGKEWFSKKFHEQSELLLGIANYRFSMMELEPNTFVRPAHWDADTIIYVVYGKGSMSFHRSREKRESHNIRTGDILRVPVGAITYLANKDSNRKLYILQLLRPISVPTQVQAFFGVGRGSYMNSFSNKVIQAAFNIEDAEKVQKLFGERRRGIMIMASQEQIESIGRSGSVSRRESRGRGPCNLLEKRPIYSNERGNYREVDEEDYTELRNIDIRVSLLNLTGGSMLVPSYNTRSTNIAFVTDGNGYVEIVCPNLSRRKQQEQEQEEEEEAQVQQQHYYYKSVASEVSQGDVFVIPPGHPTVAIASSREREEGIMQVVCFQIHARDNDKVFLAGKNNVWQQMERPAKELTFGTSAEEIERVLNAQDQEIFVPGPDQEEEEGRRGGLPLFTL